MGHSSDFDKYMKGGSGVTPTTPVKPATTVKTTSTSTPKAIDVSGVVLRDTGSTTIVKTSKGTVKVRPSLGEKIAYGAIATVSTLTLVGTGFGLANLVAAISQPQYGIFEALSRGIQAGINFAICRKTLGTTLKNSPIPGIKKMYESGEEFKEKLDKGELFERKSK